MTIHLFTKRVKNAPEKIEILLKLIEPSIGDKRVSVVKGIGWALKTIGKYYPGILEEFLEEQLNAGKRISKLLLRKATTYLQPETKGRIMDYARNLQS